MKTHQCAGGILYRQRPEIELLALKQVRKTGEVQWIAPKGHIEKGETPLDAALREVREEVGIENIGQVNFLGEDTYQFYEKNQLNEKTVTWYLMEVSPEEPLSLNEQEGFTQVLWVSEESISQFSHESFRELARLAAQTIRNFKCPSD